MAEVNFLVKKGLTVPKGSASTPAIIFDASDPNTGIYSPAADQLAISTNGTGRLFVDANGLIGVGGAPSIYSLDVTGNGIRTRESANSSSLVLGTFDAGGYTYITSDKIGTGSYQPFAFFTGGFERMRLDSSGRLGLGTSSPGSIFEAKGNSPQLIVNSTTASYPGLVFQTNGVSDGGILYNGSGDKLEFYTGDTSGNPEVVIDALGRVGIGVNAPDPGGQGLHVHNASAADSSVRITNSTTGATNGDGFAIQVASDGTARLRQFENVALTFETNATERGRWDSSGRFLVGTSSARVNYYNSAGIGSNFQVVGSTHAESSIILHNQAANTQGAYFHIGKSRGTAYEVVNNNDPLGVISFQGADGSTMREGASIAAFVDGAPGAGDLPTRLVFSTTADGASSPTERMRITNNGDFLIEKTAIDETTQGFQYDSGGAGLNATVAITNTRTDGGAGPFRLNRQGSDGTLIHFLQAATEEGSISVSGTTVSYNGAHLSRWSQLPGGAERTEVLRGTVLSNIDEMCGWGEEENEQLNRMKVSDVEGDPNVSGVFQNWDDSDDVYTDDFYCAMTGDFIIRIAEGVTVQRGELLMSAGDGTAKPQDDDIIRSKTIAKVTSTHVTCTYDDGSYCVPCVLMAC